MPKGNAVNKLFKSIRILWIKARLKVPSSVQRWLIPRLHEVKEIVRLLRRPFLPVYLLQGLGQGGPLKVAYVGLEYAKPFLEGIIFVEKPVEQRIGRVPFWQIKEVASLMSGDMIIVEATKHLIHRLPRQNAFVVPHYVHHIVDVRGDWQAVRKRFRKTIRTNELRWIRKYGYDYDVSHSRQDFETFYHHMYLPTMDERHGELSMPISIQEGYQYFLNGFLFRVTRDGDWVSGVVCHPQRQVLVADILGMKDADERLMQQGAVAATYYAAIHWANQHGYDAVNFLGAGPPCLSTGRFQHKRKWGTAISVPAHLHRRVWIKVQRNTPAVAHFLKNSPFAVIGEDGALYALMVVDDPGNLPPETLQVWQSAYATPGLSGFLVHSLEYFSAGSPNDYASGRVVPMLLGSRPEEE